MLVLATATVFFVTRGGKQAASYAPPERTQRTLLLEVQRGADVVSAALLSHDTAEGGTDGAAVLLPPSVVVSVPGSGSALLRSSLIAGRAQQSREAVEDLLGVTVDGGWVLTPTTLATMIDQVGGITLDVDVDVLPGAGTPAAVVALTRGRQRLTGPMAVMYATYLAEGELEPARLVRLQGTLEALLLALPGRAQLPALLGSLGAGSLPSWPLAQLADFLSGLARDSKAQSVQYNLLPVVPIDAGTGALSYRVDAPLLAALVARLLGPSVPASRREKGNRVFVSNGVGTPGLGSTVRSALLNAGLVFVGSRNAPTFGRPKTVILVRDATAEQQALGRRIARALKVPEGSVQTSTEVGSTADAIVVIGRDYKP